MKLVLNGKVGKIPPYWWRQCIGLDRGAKSAIFRFDDAVLGWIKSVSSKIKMKSTTLNLSVMVPKPYRDSGGSTSSRWESAEISDKLEEHTQREYWRKGRISKLGPMMLAGINWWNFTSWRSDHKGKGAAARLYSQWSKMIMQLLLKRYALSDA